MTKMKDAEQDGKELARRGDGGCDQRTVPGNAQKDEDLSHTDDSRQNGNVHSQLFAIFQESNALPHLTGNYRQGKQEEERV